MKTIKLTIAALMTLCTPFPVAQPSYFSLQAECNVNTAVGICWAVNNTNRFVYCEGWIKGQTSMGFYANGKQRGGVAPGQTFYMELHSKNPMVDPLIDVWGAVDCRF